MSRYDVVVAGAGPTGATVAQQAAEAGLRVLVMERRNHVAGNCHDAPHGDTGLLVHTYGPHYLRFNDRATFDYVSRFTRWLPGNYIVKANVEGRLVPMPINLETLELLFDTGPLDETSAAALLAAEQVPFTDPANSEELVLSRVGRRLYDLLYRNYTAKQWGRSAAELDPSVCGRIPVRLDRDPSYVDAAWQVMPRDGYTALFSRMLEDRRIDVALDADWGVERPTGTVATVYTGPLDAYFADCYGPLPWRSLRFEHRVLDQEWFQPCVQVNFPGAEPYTRRVEIKHVTRQRSDRTVVTWEYPSSTGDPYYPVPAPSSFALWARYQQLADAETAGRGVHFAGRLARYAYINTDEAIRDALVLATRILP